MIPNKQGHIRVRATMDGVIDQICVEAGQIVHAGERLVVVEGDVTLETLRAKNRSRVLEVHVAADDEVVEHGLLVVLEELPEGD